MTKGLVIICCFSIFFFYSCELSKTYEYVEFKNVDGHSPVREKREKIKASSDSAAYLKAYKLFCISKQVDRIANEAMGKTYWTSLGFKLFNDKGEDIADSIVFINKGALERMIDSSINATDKQFSSKTQNTDIYTPHYIMGLSPVDVYLNMEKQGFVTEKRLSSEYGNFWISTESVPGIDYRVETYSSNVNNVENVRASAIVDLSQKYISATQQFFVFISSLPYNGADPQRAGRWIQDNFNNDKATIVIGDARFTIYAPTSACRMINIEKAK